MLQLQLQTNCPGCNIRGSFPHYSGQLANPRQVIGFALLPDCAVSGHSPHAGDITIPAASISKRGWLASNPTTFGTSPDALSRLSYNPAARRKPISKPSRRYPAPQILRCRAFPCWSSFRSVIPVTDGILKAAYERESKSTSLLNPTILWWSVKTRQNAPRLPLQCSFPDFGDNAPTQFCLAAAAALGTLVRKSAQGSNAAIALLHF